VIKNIQGPLLALSLLTLAGCSSEPESVDTSSLADEGGGIAGFTAHDSAGRLMPARHAAAWRSRVAVYSADAALAKDGSALVEMNFNVRLVPVPESRFLIRLEPVKGGFRLSTQFNGVRSEGPTFTTGLRGHEDAQDRFVDFVGEQMENIE
jgi:hypothetical protein